MDRSGGIDVSLHTLVSSLCRTGMQLQIVDRVSEMHLLVVYRQDGM
jgi:hypothetical protein